MLEIAIATTSLGILLSFINFLAEANIPSADDELFDDVERTY